MELFFFFFQNLNPDLEVCKGATCYKPVVVMKIYMESASIFLFWLLYVFYANLLVGWVMLNPKHIGLG